MECKCSKHEEVLVHVHVLCIQKGKHHSCMYMLKAMREKPCMLRRQVKSVSTNGED